MSEHRKKPPKTQRELLDELYAGVQTGTLELSEAVKAMRRISGLNQEDFARHRGISVQSLRLIESNTGNPTVATLNKVAKVFGLKVGFVSAR
ncbi:MAG TPA: helix-turn-helix transcriptional regulator [Aquabacterium sp.]|jgi:DNA-binding XRE family transcriptional regulator|nr:helix-turn-helix transcriptional regulator [Aquabacterium sp.]HRH27949.1 helix-turn-helix transcriptional regulator [Aquabacterium sp.]